MSLFNDIQSKIEKISVIGLGYVGFTVGYSICQGSGCSRF